MFSHKHLAGLLTKEETAKDLDTSQMENRCKIMSEDNNLTKRESEVLLLLSMGRNVPGIADKLVVSPATAKTHVLHIYKKVGVSSR